MVNGDVRRVMELAALLDSAARLTQAEPGDLAPAFDAFLDRLSAASGKTRAELDGMDTADVWALLERVAHGDAYADALDVAREAWVQVDVDGGDVVE